MSASTISTNLPAVTPRDPFAPVGSKELDRQDFMTLFITQLQYQDPMEPMNSYEMASQLAQFSNMEATMKMADNMEKLLEYQTSQNNLQLLNLIGKGVEAQGNQIGLTGGAASPTSFSLAEPADLCLVNIYDAAGHQVQTLNLGYQPAGKVDLAWDGKNPLGELQDDGLYTYEVDAVSAAGQKVDVDYRLSGKVTGLEFDSGQATVTVDDYATIAVSDIIKVD